MSKLVLWFRIAKKYRPLFSLELQWLDLQILPEGSDPNAGDRVLPPKEVKQTIPAKISPELPAWLEVDAIVVLTDAAKEKYRRMRFEEDLIIGAWQVKAIQAPSPTIGGGLSRRCIVRSLVRNTREQKNFDMTELRLPKPFDYQERTSD
jgi:hypothetical protein